MSDSRVLRAGVRNDPQRVKIDGSSDAAVAVNVAVAELARRQGGHVTRQQLLSLGMGSRAIQSRRERGWLIRVYPGVYAVGRLSMNPLDRAQAALLAAGPRSALCGHSAAAYWALHRKWRAPFELISAARCRINGLKVRECGTLLPRDLHHAGGLRVTSPARTLLDMAPVTAEHMLHRFHNELRMRRLIRNEQLVDVVDRNPNHRGVSHLRRLAGVSGGEPKRSVLELDWERFACRHALGPYEMNVLVAGQRVDVLFTPARLVIELDGWGTHGTRHAFEQDRDRDSELLARTGIPTMRITHDGLHRRASDQASRIRAVLARR